MTKLENQDTPVGVSAFTRSRRTTAAVAFSLGLGSLVYGTILSLPASAAAAGPTTTACSTATPTQTQPTASTSGTDAGTPTDGAGASGGAAANDASTGTTASPGADASTSASASSTATATDTSCAPTTTTASGQPTTTTGTTTTPAPTKSATKTTTPAPTPSKTKSTIPGKGSPSGKPVTAPPGAPGKVPVYVVAPTGAYSYFTYAAVPPGNASQQLPHGTITRAQIMARAELWVQAKVPYSQSEWFTNPNGTYRQDCSGYVSMAWDLDQYTDFWTGNLNLVSHTIPAAQLEPGDILLSVEHTILFAGWANAEHTSFDYYEEAHPGTVARYVEDAPLSAFLDNGFAPFRYDGIVGSDTVPANPTTGDPYSVLAQQGSEINPTGVFPGRLRGLSPSADASGSSARAKAQIAAQAAADVSAADDRTGGMALGVGGAFLLGAGLLMRRPVMQTRKRRH